MEVDNQQYYEQIRLTEAQCTVCPNFMAIQQEITTRMRQILIDWLIEVHSSFDLQSETFFLACHIIDQYLAKQKETKQTLQLVGVAAMFIADKYEENYSPDPSDYYTVTNNSFNLEQLVSMEEKILKTIQYKLTCPTSFHFLSLYSTIIPNFSAIENACIYLLQISTLRVQMYELLPSQIAAATIYLANLMMKFEPWNDDLQRFSMYTKKEVCSWAIVINNLRKMVLSTKVPGVLKKFGEVLKLDVPDFDHQM